MIRCLRCLIGKIDTDKLTQEEWAIVGEKVHEYSTTNMVIGFILGFLIGILFGFLGRMLRGG